MSALVTTIVGLALVLLVAVVLIEPITKRRGMRL